MNVPTKLAAFATTLSVVFAGAYRLFLDFPHGGVAHTAAFTATAS